MSKEHPNMPDDEPSEIASGIEDETENDPGDDAAEDVAEPINNATDAISPDDNSQSSPPTTAAHEQPNNTTKLAQKPPAPTTVSPPLEDPVKSEPYIWGRCTVGISIQLLPNKNREETYEEAVIAIRTHSDAPLIRRVKAKDLHILPEPLKHLIKELKEDLPARGEACEERRRQEREKKEREKSKAKNTPKATKSGNAQTKPDQKSTATEITTEELMSDSLFDCLTDDKQAADAKPKETSQAAKPSSEPAASEQSSEQSNAPEQPVVRAGEETAAGTTDDSDDWFTD